MDNSRETNINNKWGVQILKASISTKTQTIWNVLLRSFSIQKKILSSSIHNVF